MVVSVEETDLPGVGKRFDVELGDEERLIVVIHNTGKREVFLRRSREADAEKLLELDDAQSRLVGSILEGVHFQPVPTHQIETILSEDALIEWVTVPEGSPLRNKTLEEAALRRKTTASVIAIQRGEETLPNPSPDTPLRAGDTLVAIGTRQAHRQLAALLKGET